MLSFTTALLAYSWVEILTGPGTFIRQMTALSTLSLRITIFELYHISESSKAQFFIENLIVGRQTDVGIMYVSHGSITVTSALTITTMFQNYCVVFIHTYGVTILNV